MKKVTNDPSQYTSSELATVDHIRDEAKKLYSIYINQKVLIVMICIKQTLFLYKFWFIAWNTRRTRRKPYKSSS